MGFMETLIPRLRNAGLTVHDVRGALPRNGGPWMRRPIDAIKLLPQHWDAEARPHAYDSLERIKAQARYHINKDWGDGDRGDGLQYHMQVDNIGDVYICRDAEDVLWQSGAGGNYGGLATCYHGRDQAPTREQIETMQKMADVMCWECPEFPAGKANFIGHQEVPGNSTACPGTFLTAVRSYRAEENTHPERYAYDWPDTSPSVPVVPAPPIVKPVDLRPEWEVNVAANNITPHRMYFNQDTYLYDITTGQPKLNAPFKKGDVVENLITVTTVGPVTYLRTKFSTDKSLWTGFRREHLDASPPVVVVPTPPVVTPPVDPDKDIDEIIDEIDKENEVPDTTPTQPTTPSLPPIEPKPVTPGYKSTEFGLVVATFIGAATILLGLDISGEQINNVSEAVVQLGTAGATLLTAGAAVWRYIKSREQIKRTAITASAVVTEKEVK